MAAGRRPIDGATNETYALTAADLGAQIACRVTATGSDGGVEATSTAVVPVPAGNTGPQGPAGSKGDRGPRGNRAAGCSGKRTAKCKRVKKQKRQAPSGAPLTATSWSAKGAESPAPRLDAGEDLPDDTVRVAGQFDQIQGG